MNSLQLLKDIGQLCQPSVNYSVCPSEITGAGKGLFTRNHIEENSVLFIAFALKGDNGKTATSLERAAAQIASDEHTEYKTLPVFEARYTQLFPNDYINHSRNPNCETAVIGDMFFVRSLREILPGEELTKDYAHTMKLIRDKGYYLADNFLNF